MHRPGSGRRRSLLPIATLAAAVTAGAGGPGLAQGGGQLRAQRQAAAAQCRGHWTAVARVFLTGDKRRRVEVFPNETDGAPDVDRDKHGIPNASADPNPDERHSVHLNNQFGVHVPCVAIRFVDLNAAITGIKTGPPPPGMIVTWRGRHINREGVPIFILHIERSKFSGPPLQFYLVRGNGARDPHVYNDG